MEKTFRDLKLQYGGALAKDIRSRKKELGAEWYREHPELPGNEDALLHGHSLFWFQIIGYLEVRGNYNPTYI